MDKCIDSLGSADVFPMLDVSGDYSQIKLDEGNMDKTEFITCNDLFRYTRMLFKLKNGPATFRRATEIILASGKCWNAFINIDSDFIFSQSPEKHLCHVESVSRVIQKAGVTLKLKKCYFSSNAVSYLGHVTTPRRFHIGTNTFNAARASKYSTIMSALLSFLEL